MTGDLSSAIAPLRNFLAKHHPVLFITCVLLLLSLAVLMLYSVLNEATPSEESSASTISQFDKATIEKIKELHDSSDTPDAIKLPSPRPNPFVE